MAGFRPGGQGPTLRQLLLEDHRRGYERTLLYLLVTGAALVVLGAAELALGTLLSEMDGEAAFRTGIWTSAAGAVLSAVSLALGYLPERLRTLAAWDLGDRYEQMRRWTRIKVLSVLLQLLALLNVLILAVAILSLAGRVDPTTNPYLTEFTVTGVPILVATVTFLTVAITHYQTLQAPTERPRTGLEPVFVSLGLAVTVVLAIGAGILATWPLTFPGVETFGQLDAPFFLLASATAAALTLFPSRGIPTLAALVTEEHRYYRGRTHLSRTKSVVLPISVAFAVLFLVLLLIVFFQLGFLGQLTEVPTNAVLLAVVGVIVAALLTSLVAAILLSRTGEEHQLFKQKRTAEARFEIGLLSVSALVATVLLGAAAALFVRGDLGPVPLAEERWLDLLAFGLMAAIGPLGFYHRARARRTRQLEERFPDFLRDLAASRKAGLTLNHAVSIAARGEYGALSPDIQKMADQLAWNVPFDEALAQFGERVDTPLVQRAISLINEAGRSGGNVTDVLEAAARDARELKHLEDERRLTMTLYTAIIYIAFLVFLGVAAVLQGTFLPEILRASDAATQSGAGGGIGSVQFTTLSLSDFHTFYFIASLTQAIGNGAIAGMIESGNAKAGLSHTFAMIVMAWFLFGVGGGGARGGGRRRAGAGPRTRGAPPSPALDSESAGAWPTRRVLGCS